MTQTRLVFDAHCVLCSGFVNFILRHERDSEIIFLSAQSAAGIALAADHGLSADDLDETFLVERAGHAYLRSSAALKLTEHFKAPWRWAKTLRLIPRPLRDAVCTFAARRRYKWFGNTQLCMVAPKESRARFIDI